MGKTGTRYALTFLILMSLMALMFILNINSGSVRLSFGEIFDIIIKRQGDRTALRIVWDIRLPRALAAMLLGGALSVSGFLLQTFFANPIAGPFVLGISSGAKLTVSLTMVFFISRGIYISSAAMILSAFAGALLSMGLVLLFSGKVKKMSLLVICGVMIGYICSAVTDFIITFADDSNIVNLHNWSMGSFSGTSWSNVGIMAIVVLSVIAAVFFLSKPMGAYQMGEAYARNVGVNIGLLRFWLIVFSSILSATVTAFAGPISFVGIAVPHIVKNMLKTPKPLLVIPACFLGGGVFCMFCDLLARVLFAPAEISISSVTAVFGAPVVIYIMASKRRA